MTRHLAYPGGPFWCGTLEEYIPAGDTAYDPSVSVCPEDLLLDDGWCPGCVSSYFEELSITQIRDVILHGHTPVASPNLPPPQPSIRDHADGRSEWVAFDGTTVARVEGRLTVQEADAALQGVRSAQRDLRLRRALERIPFFRDWTLRDLQRRVVPNRPVGLLPPKIGLTPRQVWLEDAVEWHTIRYWTWKELGVDPISNLLDALAFLVRHLEDKPDVG